MDQRKGPYWAALGNAPPLSGPQFPDLDKTSSVPTCPLPCPSRTLTICDFLPTPSWRERGRPGSCLRKVGGAGDVPSCPQPPLGSLGTGPGWQLQPRHAGVATTGAPRCLPFSEGSAPLGSSEASEALCLGRCRRASWAPVQGCPWGREDLLRLPRKELQIFLSTHRAKRFLSHRYDLNSNRWTLPMLNLQMKKRKHRDGH